MNKQVTLTPAQHEYVTDLLVSKAEEAADKDQPMLLQAVDQILEAFDNAVDVK